MARVKAPNFEIKPILEYLGFDEVPDVTSGHRKLRCHLHGERNPSASVSRYGYRCFGCGVTGDAIKLLMEQEGFTFREAQEKCEELTGGSDAAAPTRTDGWGSWWSASLPD